MHQEYLEEVSKCTSKSFNQVKPFPQYDDDWVLSTLIYQYLYVRHFLEYKCTSEHNMYKMYTISVHKYTSVHNKLKSSKLALISLSYRCTLATRGLEQEDN